MTRFSLQQINELVQDVIYNGFRQPLWMQAEISEVRENRGHCYLEFVQKDENSNSLLAKARGVIWANRWTMLRPYFERETGRTLTVGMTVLVLVQPTFHPLYGYSLDVSDIDPTFTLGDLARRRREILQQLEREGVLDMNKELELPRILQRIAVISSPSAAGYQDFENQLTNNPYNLRFDYKLFPAVMQGDMVEGSLIAALNAIADTIEEWDVVVIIRGGGASSDLSGFDTLSLAEHIVNFPLPIITGIGHERDDTVIDLVSHTRVKTPTAAAEFLIQHNLNELALLQTLAERINKLATTMVDNEQHRLMQLISRIPTAAALCQAREKNQLQLSDQRLKQCVLTILNNQKHRLQLLSQQIGSASPERILRLGFSITRINGKAVTSASSVKSGDTIATQFADGNIESTVK